MMKYDRRVLTKRSERDAFGKAVIKRVSPVALAVILMTGGLGSCVMSDTEAGLKEMTVSLGITVPEANEVTYQTKAGEIGEPAESEITKLDFFVFTYSGDVFEAHEEVIINPLDNSSTNPLWDSSKSALRMTLVPGQKKIYVIANWTGGTTEMPTIGTIQNINTLRNQVRVHTNITPTNGPVMTGYITPTLAGGDHGVEIKLYRQIARVVLYPMISVNALTLNAQIIIKGVRFQNLAQRSYMISPGNSSPSTAVWSQSAYVGAPSAALTATTTQAATRYHEPFYIPEYFGSAATHTRMVIHATYNGVDTYYTVPINGQTGAQPTLYAVERNHSYKYYVTIQGMGSSSQPSPAQAADYTDPGSVNITYELIKE